MPKPRLDLLARIMRRTGHRIVLDGGLERRVRLYHERHQAELAKGDPEAYGTGGAEEPVTLEEAISSLVECGLEAEEARVGLVGTIFGDVIPREEYDRKRSAQRTADLVRVRACRCDPYDDGPYGHDDDCAARGIPQATYNALRDQLREEEVRDGR